MGSMRLAFVDDQDLELLPPVQLASVLDHLGELVNRPFAESDGAKGVDGVSSAWVQDESARSKQHQGERRETRVAGVDEPDVEGCDTGRSSDGDSSFLLVDNLQNLDEISQQETLARPRRASEEEILPALDSHLKDLDLFLRERYLLLDVHLGKSCHDGVQVWLRWHGLSLLLFGSGRQ